MKKNFIIFLFFCISVTLVFFLAKTIDSKEQECSKNYPFVSHEIDCQKIDDVVNRVDDLHSNVGKIIEDEKNKKHIIRASVFYRDLNTKQWFGIDDSIGYYPASLIKLPIALVYFKIAQLQPGILDKQIVISQDATNQDDSDQHYPPAEKLVAGNAYSVRELIRRMLVYSDNVPFGPLSDGVSDYSERVLTDLGVYVPLEKEKQGTWNVTTKSYANIFRMLFNASYLDLDHANEVLEMLSKSTFTKGIVAGVPEGVKVAHKFGEATAMKDESTVSSLVLNDCGIIYKPKHPFVLCIMTEGNDFSQQEKVIQEIARSAYDAL
ncbi:MAG: serine hydrolase [bacterium]